LVNIRSSHDEKTKWLFFVTQCKISNGLVTPMQHIISLMTLPVGGYIL